MGAEARLASRRMVVARAASAQVVLLHGLGLDARMWDSLAPRLAAAGFSPVAVDLRGHGGSTVVDADATLDDLSDDVSRWLVATSAARPPVHLVGFSMGGMIAMRLCAAGLPLASLTLVSTSGQAEEARVRARHEAMAATFRAAPRSPELADAFLAMQFSAGFCDAHPGVRDRYRDIVMSQDATGVYRAALAVIRRPTILDRLGSIAAPTLIISGGADISTPPDHAARLQAAIAGARLLSIAGAGHLVHEEQPEQVASALIAHLKEHS